MKHTPQKIRLIQGQVKCSLWAVSNLIIDPMWPAGCCWELGCAHCPSTMPLLGLSQAGLGCTQTLLPRTISIALRLASCRCCGCEVLALWLLVAGPTWDRLRCSAPSSHPTCPPAMVSCCHAAPLGGKSVLAAGGAWPGTAVHDFSSAARQQRLIAGGRRYSAHCIVPYPIVPSCQRLWCQYCSAPTVAGWWGVGGMDAGGQKSLDGYGGNRPVEINWHLP